MKQFSFSLSEVLELREFREEEAQIELGRAVGERERIKGDLETTAKMRIQAMADLRTSALESGHPFSLMTIQNYIRRLDAQKERLLGELAKAELVVEEKRRLFTEAMAKREAITGLKNDELAQWKQEIRRGE